MFSLARRPVIVATVDCHVPKPRGMNIQLTSLPMRESIEASIESSESIPKTTLPLESRTHPKLLNVQTMIVETMMMVLAFFMNSQHLSHVVLRTFFAGGR